MRSFPVNKKTPEEKRQYLWLALLLASVPLALLLSVLLAGGQERSALPAQRSFGILLCYLWIFGALVGLGVPLRRLSRLRDERRRALVRELVADLLYSEDESLFSIAFHAGYGEARCLVKRDGAGFCAGEEELSAGRWRPTGRVWRNGDEAALWRTLDAEGYSEIAWYEEREDQQSDSTRSN